jgi:hypothetical protein
VANAGVDNIGFVQTVPFDDAFSSFPTMPISISFLATARANFSAAGGLITIQVIIGNGTTDVAPKIGTLPGTGFAGQAVLQTFTAPLVVSANYATYKFTTVAVPAGTTQFALNIFYTPGAGAAGVSDAFDITNIQMEASENATPFEYIPLVTDLARCRRFYAKSFNLSLLPAQNVGNTTGIIYFVNTIAGNNPTFSSSIKSCSKRSS